MIKMVEHKKYDKYKDSGVEWLGAVPHGWEVRKLNSFVKLQGGGTPPTNDLSLWDGDVTWVTPKDYTSSTNEYLIKSERTITEKGLKTISGLVPKDSVLMTCRAPVGNVAISGKEVSMNQGFIACLPSNKVITRYLYFSLKTANSEMNSLAKGGTFQEISRSKMGAVRFPLPPNETQHQIVEFLDRETTHIDAGVANMESLISLLTEKRTAIISETVTRGIPGEHTEFKDSGVEWLGEIPVGWGIGKFLHLADFMAGGTPDTDNLNFWDYSESGIPWVSIGDMSGGMSCVNSTKKSLTLEGLQSKNLKVLPTGTILFAMYASVGEVSILDIDATFNQALLGITPHKETDSKFVFYALKAIKSWLPNLYRSSTQNNLNAEQVKNFRLPLPPLDNQNRIVEFLDHETQYIDLAIANAKSVISLMKEKRQVLISDVVTGKIDVTERVN